MESAGILLFRKRGEALEVLLGHPGGPFWQKRDLGAWSIPKGEIDPDEDPLTAARREFQEETGLIAGDEAISLGSTTQRGGKTVHAWAVPGDTDPSVLRSNTFQLEWPPGTRRAYPEIDRFEWFELTEAARRINPAQRRFLERLAESL